MNLEPQPPILNYNYRTGDDVRPHDVDSDAEAFFRKFSYLPVKVQLYTKYGLKDCTLISPRAIHRFHVIHAGKMIKGWRSSNAMELISVSNPNIRAQTQYQEGYWWVSSIYHPGVGGNRHGTYMNAASW